MATPSRITLSLWCVAEGYEQVDALWENSTIFSRSDHLQMLATLQRPVSAVLPLTCSHTGSGLRCRARGKYSSRMFMSGRCLQVRCSFPDRGAFKKRGRRLNLSFFLSVFLSVGRSLFPFVSFRRSVFPFLSVSFLAFWFRFLSWCSAVVPANSGFPYL